VIDSHAHLHAAEFPDRADVLARARAAGVSEIVVVGAERSVDSAREAVELCEAEPGLFAVVGIHPHHASDATDGVLAEIEALAGHERVVGVGETGLDYHYDRSPRDAQQAALRAFCRMARARDKTAVLHVRDAHEDAARILREERPPRAVIHCFTGGPAEARAYLDLGCDLSFSGILTFRTAGAIREAAAAAPADRLLVETDCPYLAPVPMRGRRNEPAHLVHTLTCLAGLRGWAVDEAAAVTAANTRRVFRLPAQGPRANLPPQGGPDARDRPP
jgi:TatD DNase family protein